jgi:Flp pilus assembly protein TadD
MRTDSVSLPRRVLWAALIVLCGLALSGLVSIARAQSGAGTGPALPELANSPATGSKATTSSQPTNVIGTQPQSTSATKPLGQWDRLRAWFSPRPILPPPPVANVRPADSIWVIRRTWHKYFSPTPAPSPHTPEPVPFAVSAPLPVLSAPLARPFATVMVGRPYTEPAAEPTTAPGEARRALVPTETHVIAVQLGRPVSAAPSAGPSEQGSAVAPPQQFPTAEVGVETIPSQPTPLPPNPADRAALLGAARNAVRLGNYDLAVRRFQEYFTRFGDDPAIRREYAGVLITAGRLRQAAEQYEQMIEREPNKPDLRVALADVYQTAKEYRKAIEQFRAALRLAPDNLETATKLARAYVFDDDFLQALQVYDSYLAQLRPGEDRVPRLVLV